VHHHQEQQQQLQWKPKQDLHPVCRLQRIVDKSSTPNSTSVQQTHRFFMLGIHKIISSSSSSFSSSAHQILDLISMSEIFRR
jgi:hypothetical protein